MTTWLVFFGLLFLAVALVVGAAACSRIDRDDDDRP